MKPVIVDSNVIIDVAADDPKWGEWSANALRTVAEKTLLVINAVIFAEVSVGYERIEAVHEMLPPELFRREDIPYDAAFLAGKCFLLYRKAKGVKTSPLPDFFIGAHAAVAGYDLLTRDTRDTAAIFLPCI